MTECSVADCHVPVAARGWCKRHYYRWSRLGSPTATLQPHSDLPLPERFWAKVKPASPLDCWEWGASLTSRGYGQFWDGDRMVKAHRYAYEALVGEIPHGLTIDHLCFNRACVNPFHFDVVTQSVNGSRNSNARKTHCKRGHEFTKETTYYKKGGGRQCRPCSNEISRRQRAA